MAARFPFVPFESKNNEIEQCCTKADCAYSKQLLERFQELRNEDLLFDFTLVVQNQIFKVHKLVLAGCSDYFRAMFSHGMLESSKNTLNLDTISAEGLKPLLDFAYDGKIFLNQDNIEDILPVATFLQIRPALDLCVKFLKKTMNFENAARQVLLGQNFGLTELEAYHRRMILDNFFDFANTDMFLQLDSQTLLSYLEDDSLRTPSESKLLNVVLNWYRFDPGKRIKDSHLVFDRIRYTIQGWPLIEYASKNEPFVSNPKCQEIIKRCHKYMRKPTRQHLHQNYRTRVRYDSKSLVIMGGLYSDNQENGELVPSSLNLYYHKTYQMWLPLGVIGHFVQKTSQTLTYVNDFGMLCGGNTYRDGEYEERFYSKEVQLFIAGQFALWDMVFMQQARARHAAAQCTDYLYVIGGQGVDGPLHTVEQLHLQTNKWQFVKCLDKPLYDHAAATLDSKVIITGGIEDKKIVNTTRYYNQELNLWEERTPMLATRAGHGMTAIGDQIIVCGGRTSLDVPRCLTSVEAYKFSTNQWSILKPMRHDCAFMSTVVLDDKLMVLGGENSVGALLSYVQEFNPKTDTWGIYCHLPMALKNFASCAVTINLDAQGYFDELDEEYESRFDYSDSDDERERLSDDDPALSEGYDDPYEGFSSETDSN